MLQSRSERSVGVMRSVETNLSSLFMKYYNCSNRFNSIEASYYAHLLTIRILNLNTYKNLWTTSKYLVFWLKTGFCYSLILEKTQKDMKYECFSYRHSFRWFRENFIFKKASFSHGVIVLHLSSILNQHHLTVGTQFHSLKFPCRWQDVRCLNKTRWLKWRFASPK